MSDVPDHLSDNLPPSFTRLYFESDDGNLATSSVHDPVSEIKNLYEDIEEGVNNLRDNQNPERLDVGVDEPMLPRPLRQDVLSLYALSSAVIEAFAAELVKRELVVEEYRGLEGVDAMFQRATGVKENLRLLYDMKVIDNGLHGELQNIVGKRNGYVHDPASTISIEDYDEFLSEARRCKRATKQLAVVLDGEDHRNW
jgi:hypothetical protein